MVLSSMRPLEQCPVPIGDVEQMHELVDGCHWFILACTTDMASVNFVVISWLFSSLSKLPPHAVGHWEPCGAHQLSLVKRRSPFGGQVAAALNSFSRLMRNLRFRNALEQVIMTRISSTLKVKHEQRPQVYRQRGASLLRALFGDPSSPHLHRKCGRGGEQTRNSDFYMSAEAFVDNFDIDMSPDHGLVHWCWVEAGSPEEACGMEVGARCCQTREDSVSRVCSAVVKYMFGSAWEAGVLSISFLENQKVCRRWAP